MLGVFSIVVWLASLAVYVLCWIPAHRGLAFGLYDGPMFVMHVMIVVLAGLALSANGSDTQGAKMTEAGLRAFYRRKPRFTWMVQILMLALWIVALALFLWPNPGFAGGRMRIVDGHCLVNGVAIDDTTCETLSVNSLRFFAGAWISFGWLAVAQFLFARPDERFALDDDEK